MTRPRTTSPAEDRPPLPAREALEGFRDLGVRDEHGEGRLACDPSFNRYTAYWVLGETLDAAYVALEGARRVHERRYLGDFPVLRPQLVAFTADHFDAGRGRFKTDASRRTEGIFAQHSAIGLLRLLQHGDLEQPLSRAGFESAVEELGGDSGEALAGLDALIADCRQGDGMVENPRAPLIPSLTAVYTAASVLWHVGPQGGPGLYRFIDPRRLERFFDGCIQRQRVSDRWIAGFSIHPDHRELCVNTTSFGLRLRQRLGLGLEAPLCREIENFLLLSFGEGGFSSTLWEEPASLNATFLGLRALQTLMERNRWEDFVRRNGPAIRSFVDACAEPDTGGARFTRDRLRYRENCLATRYRIQILDLLGIPGGGDQDKTYDFLKGQLFRAYPEHQLDASALDAEGLERFLNEKDATLLRNHRQELDDPARPLTYRPDTRMLELYDRLADLEDRKTGSPADTAVTAEIEAVWNELRSRQRQEADLFENRFHAQVLEPLNESQRALDRLEDLLNHS